MEDCRASIELEDTFPGTVLSPFFEAIVLKSFRTPPKIQNKARRPYNLCVGQGRVALIN